MVSCLLLRAKGILTADHFESLFDYHVRAFIELPLAPAEFLFLRNTAFDFYNMFHYTFNPRVFPRLCPREKDFHEFFAKFIREPIVDIEIDKAVFTYFTSQLNLFCVALQKESLRNCAKQKFPKRAANELSHVETA